MTSTTIPAVFIIESLELEDEENNQLEGEILGKMLSLSGVPSIYYYIRTLDEFVEIMKIFNKSKYRYLHLSCHGGDGSIWTTLDEIYYHDLPDLFKDYLKNKRLFLSACSVVNKVLASEVIPKADCYSIIGPQKDIFFKDSPIMWASFYHLMFNENSKMMNREGIIRNLTKVADTFDQPLQYFSKSKKKGIKNKLIKPNHKRWAKINEGSMLS